jgi:CHAT domain-containing protein
VTAWQKKRVGRAEALRQSIARMLADPAAPQLHHPRAWASMILVGAPD